MLLLEVIRCGCEPHGADSCFFVRAESLEQAAVRIESGASGRTKRIRVGIV